MSIFRRLFLTYLLVAVLALMLSGGFASYLVWQAAGRNEFHRLEVYGMEMAELLEDRPWAGEPLRSFQAAAQVFDRSNTARVWLVDMNDTVIWASQSVAGDVGRHWPTDEGPVVPGRARVQWFFERQAMRDGPAGVVPVMSDGEQVGKVVFRPMSLVIRGVRTTIARFILYGSLAAAAILAVISFWLSQRLAGPLARIGAATRRVAQGDFTSRVQWESGDEVGRLARNFNEMAAELETLETARKELMANVSHELKGPLARIAGYLEAIRDGVGGETAREQHFAIVHREVARLTRLVNDLLDYSRLEVGRLKLHPFPCDLAPSLSRAAQVFAQPAADAGVVLEAAIPPMLPFVECEPERMEQVVANLLENALAFTPRGGHIVLTAAESGGMLQVTVADTGPGIPAAELERIFDRFYKLDRARTPDRRGFGLGLTIVRQLVELHGGTVFAESEEGQGSRFGFRLPLAKPS